MVGPGALIAGPDPPEGINNGSIEEQTLHKLIIQTTNNDIIGDANSALREPLPDEPSSPSILFLVELVICSSSLVAASAIDF